MSDAANSVRKGASIEPCMLDAHESRYRYNVRHHPSLTSEATRCVQQSVGLDDPVGKGEADQ